jgi:energy-coupling factor transporter ATP-binding protein EcfA2
MLARLAFAMSMAIEFDCFLIDEVIAVGDANFQAKCRDELFVRRHDRAMIMVSHDPHMIREHCSRACVLERGILREFADVDTAFDFYYETTGQSGKRSTVASSQLPTASRPIAPSKDTLTPAKPSTQITDFVLPTHQMTTEKRNEQIILAFYRTLLGREPEPSGLKHHTELMAQRDSELAIEQTLKMFLASEESKGHFERKALTAFPDTERAAPKYYDHIVSLGTHCYTSSFLKRFQLKRFSSAFDWIFSNPSMIAHAINDNFETFLDRQHYAPVPVHERKDGPEVNRVQHTFYQQNHGVDFVFNHHDVHEPNDYAYLVRCVERFRSCLKGDANTLFLMIRREDPRSNHDFELVRTALKHIAPECAFVFVAVASGKTTTGVPNVIVSSQDSHSALYHFTGSSDWQTLQFADPFDEVCLFRTIFKNFRPNLA